MSDGQWEADVALLDASTEPRIARSGRTRGPAPPARRPSASTRPCRAANSTEPDRAAPTRTRVRVAPDPAPSPPTRRSRAWILVLAGALVSGLVTGGALAALGVHSTRAPSGISATSALRSVHQLGTVTSAPQAVSVTFTLNDAGLVPGFSDRVTYRAVGTDTASVALTAVAASDVRLVGTHARVLIPAAQLGTAVLDPTQSGVVTDNPGLGTQLFNSGISTSDLENEAVTRLGTEAQADGVPLSAQRVAAAEVQVVLRRLGVTSVVVAFASS